LILLAKAEVVVRVLDVCREEEVVAVKGGGEIGKLVHTKVRSSEHSFKIV
jgi:hypothetical protein